MFGGVFAVTITVPNLGPEDSHFCNGTTGWSFVMYERPILDEEAKAHFAGKNLHSLATTHVLQVVMLKRQSLCILVTRPGIVS